MRPLREIFTAALSLFTYILLELFRGRSEMKMFSFSFYLEEGPRGAHSGSAASGPTLRLALGD